MLDWLWAIFGEVPELHGEVVRARIAKQRVVPIAEVTDGARACITGTVEATGGLVSPMTNQPCAGWFISIDEVGTADKRFAGVLACHGEMIVRDETGDALVGFEGARFALPTTGRELRRDNQGRGSWTATARDAFERSGASVNYPQSSLIHFHEHAIFSGTRVYVFGHAQREPDRGRIDADVTGYRGDAPTRPVFSGTRKVPLLLAASKRQPRTP
jgi:hypothetical protein